MRAIRLLVLICSTLFIGFGTRAQKLQEDDIKRIMEECADILEENYVFPEIALQYKEALYSMRDEMGKKEDVDPEKCAELLTVKLQDIQRDRHLRIIPPSMQSNTYRPGNGVSMEDAIVRRIKEERRHNFYLDRVEVFPGNIGYFRLKQFPVPDPAQGKVDAIMNYLADTEAVILDLRSNPGGVEGLNQYISSYFFGRGSDTVLYSRYLRPEDSTVIVRSIPDLPGERLVSQDLYILVDRFSGSSAENLAFSLQSIGRATIVGEQTAGAAHSSRIFPLPEGFSIQVPIARVSNPYVSGNWEGRGVQPELECDSEKALLYAREEILQSILRQSKDSLYRNEVKAALEDLRRTLKREEQPDLSPEEAQRYSGQYEGNRTVFYEGGSLYLQKKGGPELKLIPLDIDRDRFQLKIPSLNNPGILFNRNSEGMIQSMRLEIRGREVIAKKIQ